MWIVNIISIIVLYFIYIYLKQLHTCNCVNNTYVSRLKYLEVIFLALNVIAVCFAIFNKMHILGALAKLKEHIFKILMIGGIFMLLVYGFFAYNGYEFWLTMKDKCVCADGWQKYFIYLQTVVAGIILLLTVILSGLSVFKRVTGSTSPVSVSRSIRRSRRTKM